MAWWNWNRGEQEPEEEPSLEERQAALIDEALTNLKHGIDLVNEAIPTVRAAGLRYSIYVDRTHNPARLVLTDWGQSEPVVIHGAE